MANPSQLNGKLVPPLFHEFAWKDGSCAECGLTFEDHHHRVAYLQKVLAVSDGKEWRRCTIRQRGHYKELAVTWMAVQAQRMLSKVAGAEPTQAPQPSST